MNYLYDCVEMTIMSGSHRHKSLQGWIQGGPGVLMGMHSILVVKRYPSPFPLSEIQ